MPDEAVKKCGIERGRGEILYPESKRRRLKICESVYAVSGEGKKTRAKVSSKKGNP